MEVRTYFATTVEAAMELARKELGADAMLIQSSQTTPETAHMGRYEVVFAGEVQPAAMRGRQTAPPAPHSNRAERPPLISAFDQIVPRVRSIQSDEYCGFGPVDLLAKSPQPASLDSRMGKASKLSPAPIVARSTKPVEEIPRRISCSPGLTHGKAALVGPAGAGKTSMLMKLAVTEGIMQSRPVRILSFDPYRVGAGTQLHYFAELLHLEWASFETPDELSSALSVQTTGLTLVDTHGYGLRETDALEELAWCLRSHSDLQTHLVLRADRKRDNNLSAIERFSPFGCARLILTALDEATDLSDFPELAAHAGMPVSFLSTGQRVPEDIEPAHPQLLAELLQTGRLGKARTAA